MINNRKMNVVKRIAFVESDNNRKSLIEWSYYNQEILKNHELIATGAMADILEGTVGKPVTRLHDGAAAANHQLSAMITGQQELFIIIVHNPSNGAYYDLAMNISWRVFKITHRHAGTNFHAL